MPLSELDRNLLERCLQRKPRAWEEFVERFGSVVAQVVDDTARSRGLQLSAADRSDHSVAVFSAIMENDFAVLRDFHGKSSLATYLTVVARRIVVKRLLSILPGGE